MKNFSIAVLTAFFVSLSINVYSQNSEDQSAVIDQSLYSENEERNMTDNEIVEQEIQEVSPSEEPSVNQSNGEVKKKKKDTNVDNESAVVSETAEDENSNESHSDKSNAWGKIIIGSIFAICMIVSFKKRYRCPKCGKWFVMEHQGNVRVYDHDYKGNISKRGARKKYRCKNCGYVRESIEWFTTKL